jgi:hypothetical protein
LDNDKPTLVILYKPAVTEQVPTVVVQVVPIVKPVGIDISSWVKLIVKLA